MRKFKTVVYRNYEIELEFDETAAPEMIGPEDKAEFISRSKDISEWKLTDVAVDVYNVQDA